VRRAVAARFHRHGRRAGKAHLQIIQESGEDVPHARELVSSLWMRSMSPGRTVGGTRQELQLDITKQAAIDDNAFQAELNRLIENSKNIHGEESPEGRLHFEIGENPRSLVRATALHRRRDDLPRQGRRPHPQHAEAPARSRGPTAHVPRDCPGSEMERRPLERGG